MCIETERAVEFYRKACAAMELGNTDLAEVYYLQSIGCFEKSAQPLNAANALNALAQLRRSRGDYDGALYAAKSALQIIEQCEVQSADADLIRETAWEFIEITKCEL